MSLSSTWVNSLPPCYHVRSCYLCLSLDSLIVCLIELRAHDQFSSVTPSAPRRFAGPKLCRSSFYWRARSGGGEEPNNFLCRSARRPFRLLPAACSECSHGSARGDQVTERCLQHICVNRKKMPTKACLLHCSLLHLLSPSAICDVITALMSRLGPGPDGAPCSVLLAHLRSHTATREAMLACLAVGLPSHVLSRPEEVHAASTRRDVLFSLRLGLEGLKFLLMAKVLDEAQEVELVAALPRYLAVFSKYAGPLRAAGPGLGESPSWDLRQVCVTCLAPHSSGGIQCLRQSSRNGLPQAGSATTHRPTCPVFCAAEAALQASLVTFFTELDARHPSAGQLIFSDRADSAALFLAALKVSCYQLPGLLASEAWHQQGNCVVEDRDTWVTFVVLRSAIGILARSTDALARSVWQELVPLADLESAAASIAEVGPQLSVWLGAGCWAAPALTSQLQGCSICSSIYGMLRALHTFRLPICGSARHRK